MFIIFFGGGGRSNALTRASTDLMRSVGQVRSSNAKLFRALLQAKALDVVKVALAELKGRELTILKKVGELTTVARVFGERFSAIGSKIPPIRPHRFQCIPF